MEQANRERYCQHRDRFGNRCCESVAADSGLPFCTEHYPDPRRMTALDVGPVMVHRVYFVLAAECEVVKIGTTKNLTKRLRALNHASPTPLILLGSLEGGVQVERWFHHQCIAARSHLEWFHWTPFVCSLVDSAVRLGQGAARHLCPAEYQTDRSGLEFVTSSPLPTKHGRGGQ